MATEIQLLKRALVRGVALHLNVNALQIDATKMPGAYATARSTAAGQTALQWLQAQNAAISARLTSGVVVPGDPQPNGVPRRAPGSEWYGYWVRLDGEVYRFQHSVAWDAEGAEAARAAALIEVRRDVLHAELVEDYIDWLLGL